MHCMHMHNGAILAKCHGPGVGGCAVCWRVALRCVLMCCDVLCHLESESCAVSRASSVQCPVIV